MEKNSEDPIKNENKDCPFVFSNFKKWLNNQSEEKENKKPYVGLNVEPKISESKLLNKIEPVVIETGLSVVAVIGENMKENSGISAKLFGALGMNGVNVKAIAQRYAATCVH